ncbi:hypothetical protein PHYSODRAFT_307371 [Phytophthora sojae]|uniref:Uncharacterized protein n=1 Tax=Phytophthora sojae (strain P6497) TaxID=1094619 RepID=G5AE45_PHYSP|nr:hypothetical protein PHYSODRAFT_307371 [Phytophthora sojae]EGZ06447.1 hypothetical protein PHYSODRAFT_307371 [Phytophthora sojae]|eukprot:XP_009538344.1 hypothetical protein PHYSODRAFT_307371 [Phytophthora sojae]
MDRQGEGHRKASARRASDDFRAWTTEQGLMSCFKHRFPTQPRFTYQNGSTRTALDDIYISGRHTHQIQQSRIWLYSLHLSDHVGVPFVSIALGHVQHTPARLKNVRAFKVLPVKGASKDELHSFKTLLAGQLASGTVRLIDPLCGEPNADADIQNWLTSAIDNLYKCMYQAAKRTWGERSQTRRAIDRAVSIKRTTRCHDQLKAAVRRLQKQAGVDEDELRRESGGYQSNPAHVQSSMSGWTRDGSCGKELCGRGDNGDNVDEMKASACSERRGWQTAKLRNYCGLQ